jgi:hypothetical protein
MWKKKSKKNVPIDALSKTVMTPVETIAVGMMMLIGMFATSSIIEYNSLPISKAERPIVILDVNTSRIYYAIDINFTNETTMSFYDIRCNEYVTLKDISQKKSYEK